MRACKVKVTRYVLARHNIEKMRFSVSFKDDLSRLQPKDRNCIIRAVLELNLGATLYIGRLALQWMGFLKGNNTCKWLRECCRPVEAEVLFLSPVKKWCNQTQHFGRSRLRLTHRLAIWQRDLCTFPL